MKRWLWAIPAVAMISAPSVAKSDLVSDELLLTLTAVSAGLAVAKSDGEGILSQEVLLAISALTAGLAVIVDVEDPESP